MHKNATKCNKTQSKWRINKHGASKIIDTFETYHYVSDPVIAALVQEYAVTPPPPTATHTFHQGILRYKGRIMIGNNQTLQDNIFSALHCSAIGGHSGMRSTYQRIKRMFHWTGLKQWVEAKVTACPVCQ
jgi:hypothetical protein